MSISSIEIIKARILTATENSKIAIFKDTKDNEVVFDAVFDSTINTQKRINEKCERYIGSYYGNSGLNAAMDDMNKAYRNIS